VFFRFIFAFILIFINLSLASANQSCLEIFKEQSIFEFVVGQVRETKEELKNINEKEKSNPDQVNPEHVREYNRKILKLRDIGNIVLGQLIEKFNSLKNRPEGDLRAAVASGQYGIPIDFLAEAEFLRMLDIKGPRQARSGIIKLDDVDLNAILQLIFGGLLEFETDSTALNKQPIGFLPDHKIPEAALSVQALQENSTFIGFLGRTKDDTDISSTSVFQLVWDYQIGSISYYGTPLSNKNKPGFAVP